MRRNKNTFCDFCETCKTVTMHCGSLQWYSTSYNTLTLGISPNHKISNYQTRNQGIKIFNFSVIKSTQLPSSAKSITSTSNPFVKHCVKLRQSSSYRHSHASVIVVGSTLIRSSFLYPISQLFSDFKVPLLCNSF